MDWMGIPGREAPPYKSVVGKEATRDQALVANMATAPPTPETTTPPIPRPTLVLNFTERCPRGARVEGGRRPGRRSHLLLNTSGERTCQLSIAMHANENPPLPMADAAAPTRT